MSGADTKGEESAGKVYSLAELAAGGLSNEGRRRRAECPDYLKRRIRAAIKRNRKALHDAFQDGLDIGADGRAVLGVVVDQILGELPNLISGRWAALRGAGSHEGEQSADGPAACVESRSTFVIRHGGVSVKVELTSVGSEP